MEYIILVLILFYCLASKPINIILLLCLLLPIHGTLKIIAFSSGGDIFAYWKEFAILICFLKVMHYGSIKSLMMPFCIYAFYIMVFAIVGIAGGYNVNSDLKNLIFPLLLMFCIMKMNLGEAEIFKVLFFIIVGSLLIDLTCLIDFISPTARFIFRDLMKVTYTIAADGTVYYDITSFSIQGVNRAAGLMGGGPNQVGVYNAAILTTFMFVKLYFSYYLSGFKKIIIYVCSALSCFCFIFSFSRAGWALLAMVIIFVLIKNKKLRISTLLQLSTLTILLVFILMQVSPLFDKVVTSTFSGDEASSAARGSMTLDALNFFISNPFGYGLGSTSQSSGKNVYFAESYFINTAIQIGIFGFMALTLFYKKVYDTIKNVGRGMHIMGMGLIIALYITSFVSVNTNEVPFNYFVWMLLGLTMSNINQHDTRELKYKD